MDPLSSLLSLSDTEKAERGLIYTAHEIAQQPATWRRTFSALRSRQAELTAFLDKVGLRGPASQRPTVLLIGAGTSDYIGQSLYLLLQSCWQTPVVAVASTTLLTNFAELLLPGRPYLCISFSRSGDSPEGVAVLERILQDHPKAAHLLISCNRDGQMHAALQGHAASCSIVLEDAVNDRSLAMTSSFTNMLLAGQFLAHAWDLAPFSAIVAALAQAGDSLLPRAATLASRLAVIGYPRACFVGSGALAGAALESGLKVLELTAGRVQTMVQSTLALRHGPMAALTPETLFVALVSTQPQRRSYELDLLRQIGQRGLVRTRIAVTLPTAEAGADDLHDVCEEVLMPERFDGEIPDAYRPVLDILFAQSLGFFASLRHGLQPDAPSPNGAISRVVEKIRIY